MSPIKIIAVLCCLLLLTSSSSRYVLAAEKIRTALFFDDGAHPRSLLRENLSKDPTLSMVVVDGEAIRNDCLNNIDVLFLPGGSGKREAFSLGEEGRDKVCRFVKDGGIYVGVCAGCYLASCAHPEYLALIPATTVDKEHWRRGKATLPISFTKLGMEIFGYPQTNANVLYHNGPILRPLNSDAAELIVPLGYFRGEVVAKGGKPGLMVDAPAMVLSRYGDGLVLGISQHPEATPGLTTIELNAIHWLYAHRIRTKPNTPANIPANTRANISAKLSSQPSKKPSSAIFISNSSTNLLPQRLYDRANEIFSHTTHSHYQHLHEGVVEQVQQLNGNYQTTTDCSGFVSYVIEAVAPNHYASIAELTSRAYPHAETFAKFFLDLPTDSSAKGWLRLDSFRALQRGDIIAWERAQNSKGANERHSRSGHVMIVIDPPGKIITQSVNNNPLKYVEIYVLDSSSVEHFAPQSLPPLAHQKHRDGLGKGTIRLILDNQDDVIGFWEGTFSHEKNKPIQGPSYTNKVGFARLISLVNNP